MKIGELLSGTLLGDASIQARRSKYGNYFYYKLTAKDKNFLKWCVELFQKFGINCYITQDNKIFRTFLSGFYMNKYYFLLNFHKEWYKNVNGKVIKTIPKNLELTSTTLLFWYLGDGSLIRRKNDENRVPFIVLATNTFSKKNVDLLIQKLKDFNLNFYPVKYKSGFTKKESGYCLYSNTQDGTPYRFFELIGFECPKEIENCSTGCKGIYREEKFFKDKWPTDEDWLKILSNVKEIAKILKKKRKQSNLTQKQVAELVGFCREHVRDLENGRRYASVRLFRKVLKALNIEIQYLLNEIKGEER